MKPAGLVLLVVLFGVSLLGLAVLPFLDLRPSARAGPAVSPAETRALLERCIDDALRIPAVQQAAVPQKNVLPGWRELRRERGVACGVRAAPGVEGRGAITVMAVAPAAGDFAASLEAARIRFGADLTLAPGEGSEADLPSGERPAWKVAYRRPARAVSPR